MANESYHQNLHQVERLNSELLVWVMVLEATHDHPIVIPDSPLAIPILASGGNLLVEIDNEVDNEVVQAIMEDQAEVVRRRVTIREGGAFGVAREFYKEGEDLMDVICQVEAWDVEVPRYQLALDYDDLNYIPDVQE